MRSEQATVRLEPWRPGLLPLLEQTMGDTDMTRYLGGPEDAAKLADRQSKYERLADSGEGRMFAIVDLDSGEPVGSVGYWDKEWQGVGVYETGWFVIPSFQGRGIAATGTLMAMRKAKEDGKHRFVHAYPSIENLASNAICRKLGFTLLEEHEFEFPPGHFMKCNDWRFDLNQLDA